MRESRHIEARQLAFGLGLMTVFLMLVTLQSIAQTGSSPPTDCNGRAAKGLNPYAGFTGSLLSPDQRWQLMSVGSESPERGAALYIRNVESSKKWNVGGIERSGTAYWSDDSKWLLLRDEFAADDTKLRAFNVAGDRPKEISGLDGRIRRAIFAKIPPNETTLWLYYPEVCFGSGKAPTIIVTADAPLVPKTESGSGKSFRLRLTVNLDPLEVQALTHLSQ